MKQKKPVIIIGIVLIVVVALFLFVESTIFNSQANADKARSVKVETTSKAESEATGEENQTDDSTKQSKALEALKDKVQFATPDVFMKNLDTLLEQKKATATETPETTQKPEVTTTSKLTEKPATTATPNPTVNPAPAVIPSHTQETVEETEIEDIKLVEEEISMLPTDEDILETETIDDVYVEDDLYAAEDPVSYGKLDSGDDDSSSFVYPSKENMKKSKLFEDKNQLLVTLDMMKEQEEAEAAAAEEAAAVTDEEENEYPSEKEIWIRAVICWCIIAVGVVSAYLIYSGKKAKTLKEEAEAEKKAKREAVKAAKTEKAENAAIAESAKKVENTAKVKKTTKAVKKRKKK